jgi:hypothetical protein
VEEGCGSSCPSPTTNNTTCRTGPGLPHLSRSQQLLLEQQSVHATEPTIRHGTQAPIPGATPSGCDPLGCEQGGAREFGSATKPQHVQPLLLPAAATQAEQAGGGADSSRSRSNKSSPGSGGSAKARPSAGMRTSSQHSHRRGVRASQGSGTRVRSSHNLKQQHDPSPPRASSSSNSSIGSNKRSRCGEGLVWPCVFCSKILVWLCSSTGWIPGNNVDHCCINLPVPTKVNLMTEQHK